MIIQSNSISRRWHTSQYYPAWYWHNKQLSLQCDLWLDLLIALFIDTFIVKYYFKIFSISSVCKMNTTIDILWTLIYQFNKSSCINFIYTLLFHSCIIFNIIDIHDISRSFNSKMLICMILTIVMSHNEQDELQHWILTLNLNYT